VSPFWHDDRDLVVHGRHDILRAAGEIEVPVRTEVVGLLQLDVRGGERPADPEVARGLVAAVVGPRERDRHARHRQGHVRVGHGEVADLEVAHEHEGDVGGVALAVGVHRPELDAVLAVGQKRGVQVAGHVLRRAGPVERSAANGVQLPVT